MLYDCAYTDIYWCQQEADGTCDMNLFSLIFSSDVSILDTKFWTLHDFDTAEAT